ncbi:hypothetical protein KKC13_00325 [bacterium]|nr:hypothetical protein [bacterium]MBU1957202.1 hypothetical protein [bacterium]
MKLEELESKYNYKFPTLFTMLWNDGMLDWMNGRTTPFSSDESWEKSIYPIIKENPPLLLHSGGLDFELLTSQGMYDFTFDELWDIETHEFIPFAITKEGTVYAFYPNIKTNGESAIVCIWNDMNETEVLAKNFEDFIFRKMLESVYDIDTEDLFVDYKESEFEGYRADLLNDLRTISPYLKASYVTILNEIYNRKEVLKGMFSYGLLTQQELAQLIQTHLAFNELDAVFEHEID